ncbi:hypothetical protein [Eubacterium sp. An3]|uniref:hypothetical protein n=1 Tax=Eubacterium sp. An3 TaxID=1965628 RepID=UPI000B3A2499|nr:hypothetical protein [Eubacterium sp. An3]OUO25753.1 hypothetical protein B5F87_16470 [Eubacterium sp. An3]
MLIQAIRNFREKTKERYEAAEEEKMEQWKKDVRALHENAAFLFYYEEVEPEPNSLLKFLIRGEIVKGEIPQGSPLLLLDGQARELGRAEVMSDTEEKEEKRLGLMHIKRNQFVIRITELYGEKAETMEVGSYRRQADSLWEALSLITNVPETEAPEESALPSGSVSSSASS